MFHTVPLSDGCRNLFSMQQNDTIQKFCLCLIPPRSFAYSVSPCHRFRPFRCTSFLRFVVFSPHSSLLASAVTAVVLHMLVLFFLCLALFVLLSVLLAVICARLLPFFSVPFCFIFQQSQKACYMFNSSTNGKDITKTRTGEIKAGDLVVKAWDNPPFHRYCSKRL